MQGGTEVGFYGICFRRGNKFGGGGPRAMGYLGIKPNGLWGDKVEVSTSFVFVSPTIKKHFNQTSLRRTFKIFL